MSPTLPFASTEVFDSVGNIIGKSVQSSDGFVANNVPSVTGLGTRTGRLPANRTGISTRKLIHWLVPEGPIVQMYINPQNITYNYSKAIENQRTKGGFVIQYWGENLTILNITGTTGSSGIEGINVLHDIYRNEQLAFDPYALFQAAALQEQARQANAFDLGLDVFGASSFESGAFNFAESLFGSAQEEIGQNTQGPTLASLATQVEMYWSGEVYRGYFNNFIITERADNLGMFEYSIQFTVTQKRGFRSNFLAWHRSPVFGPSNSDPTLGPPYSYSNLTDGILSPPRRTPQADVIDEVRSLGQGIADTGNRIAGLFE